MRLRTLLIGSLALVFGGSAAVGAYLLMAQPAITSGVETVSIVVTALDAPRGATLAAEQLTMQEWPEGYLPKGALRSLEEAEGRTVWVPIFAGEPVTEAKLTERGAGRGMAAMIPRGMRAVTLHTPSVSTAMAGFILPGNKVDVLLTVSQPGASSGSSSSVTLLQNVEVLAVDQQIDAPSGNLVNPDTMQSVTLLVTPAQAARLDLGQNRGMLRLALRNPKDSETSEVEPAMLSALQLGPDDPDAVAEQATFAADVPEPLVVDPAQDPESIESPTEESPVKPTQQPQVAEKRPEVLIPVRTLRGTQSGTLYLRPNSTVAERRNDASPRSSTSRGD